MDCVEVYVGNGNIGGLVDAEVEGKYGRGINEMYFTTTEYVLSMYR